MFYGLLTKIRRVVPFRVNDVSTLRKVNTGRYGWRRPRAQRRRGDSGPAGQAVVPHRRRNVGADADEPGYDYRYDFEGHAMRPAGGLLAGIPISSAEPAHYKWC